MSAFARFHRFQKVQQKDPQNDNTIYQVQARLMDLDSGEIIYFCITKEGYRHVFPQSGLKAVEC